MANQESLILFFDIYGFPMVANDIGLNETATRLKNLWDWVNNNIKINRDNIKIKTYFFSDCGFIVYDVPIKDRDKIALKCYGDAMLLLKEYLENDFFLRGVITYGKNIIHKKNIIIGEAVNIAVRLEKRCPGPFIIFPFDILQSFISNKIIKLFPKPMIMNLKNLMEQ